MMSEEKGPGQIISTHSPTRVLPWKARYYYVTQKPQKAQKYWVALFKAQNISKNERSHRLH